MCLLKIFDIDWIFISVADTIIILSVVSFIRYQSVVVCCGEISNAEEEKNSIFTQLSWGTYHNCRSISHNFIIYWNVFVSSKLRKVEQTREHENVYPTWNCSKLFLFLYTHITTAVHVCVCGVLQKVFNCAKFYNLHRKLAIAACCPPNRERYLMTFRFSLFLSLLLLSGNFSNIVKGSNWLFFWY